ncbi:MipA/OmpV family protein [Rhizobium nepotum]|uniref:MipA/OmpV family protein n=1 Tax=Rhizobium nepotum TaxID=1035271 RepID=UPI00336AD8B1
MIMKQIFTAKWHKNLRALALCLTALPMAQALCTPVFAADIGKSDRSADPQGNFDDARYSSSSEWKITLGVGAVYAPKYEGSDKFEAGPFPLVSVQYGDTLSIDFSGATVNLFNQNGFRLGVKGGWEEGRKEKNDKKNLRGMGDIKAGGVVGGVVAYGIDPFEIYAKVDKTIGGSESLTATVGASVSQKYEQFIFGADLSATWADDNHMKSYFGVTSAQSARSGLRRYDAKSGFKRIDASASVSYLMTENWTLTGAGGVGFLIGDAKESPISKKDLQPFAMLGVSYTF